jgi:hypothetical protein
MKRTIWKRFYIALPFLALCLSVSALAQQASVIGKPAGEGLVSPARELGDGPRSFTDIFLGRNVVGPYLLSWKGIEPESETISRGAKRLVRGVDYQLDLKTGALTFSSPLKMREIARVDYRITPGKAIANASAPPLPIQFGLFQRGGSALTFNALYRPDTVAPLDSKSGGTGAIRSGLMLLGFNGNFQMGRDSSLAGQLLLDGSGGNLFERSAVQFREQSKYRYGQFTASYTRAGAEFKASQETGINAGREIIEASGSLNAVRGIQATASFMQTTDLPIEGKGQVVTVLGMRVNGRLGAATRVQYSRTETETTVPDGFASTRWLNRFQLDQAVNRATLATALFESNVLQTEDSHTILQTSSLSVRSQVSDRVSVSGSYQNRLSASGAEDTASLRLEATPTQTLRISAQSADRYTLKGTRRTRGALLEYTPFPLLSVSSGLEYRADSGNEDITRSFFASARPLPTLEVAGGLRQRESLHRGVPDPNAPDSYDVRLTWGLNRNRIRLTGAYANDPEDDKGAIMRLHRQSIGLQSTLGNIELGGGYSLEEEYLTARTSEILDLRLGWRFGRATSLNASYRSAWTREQNLMGSDTYSLIFAHRIGSLFDLMFSGSMTNYLKNGLLLPNQEYRAEARLGIRF